MHSDSEEWWVARLHFEEPLPIHRRLGEFVNEGWGNAGSVPVELPHMDVASHGKGIDLAFHVENPDQRPRLDRVLAIRIRPRLGTVVGDNNDHSPLVRCPHEAAKHPVRLPIRIGNDLRVAPTVRPLIHPELLRLEVPPEMVGECVGGVQYERAEIRTRLPGPVDEDVG